MYEGWHGRGAFFIFPFKSETPPLALLNKHLSSSPTRCVLLYALCFVVSFLTPLDWSDPELSDLCVLSKCRLIHTYSSVCITSGVIVNLVDNLVIFNLKEQSLIGF